MICDGFVHILSLHTGSLKITVVYNKDQVTNTKTQNNKTHI